MYGMYGFAISLTKGGLLSTMRTRSISPLAEDEPRLTWPARPRPRRAGTKWAGGGSGSSSESSSAAAKAEEAVAAQWPRSRRSSFEKPRAAPASTSKGKLGRLPIVRRRHKGWREASGPSHRAPEA
eukprot:scaffold9153_cov122-Isochrysis_galbana.AAC.2